MGESARHEPPPVARAEIVVDLDAIRHNVATCEAVVARRPGDDDGGQGRRLRPRDGRGRPRPPAPAGADWLGVATIEEALALRAAGDTGRMLCWLTVPGEDYAAADRGRTSTSRPTPSPSSTRSPPPPARSARRARVQLKVDTGLSRGGATARGLAGAGRGRAPTPSEAGALRVTGIWSHFACSDEPDHPANDAQEQAFRDALHGRRRGRPRARGAPPRQLRRRAAAARGPASTWCGAASRRTASTRRPTCVTSASSACVPAMTVARPARAGQADRRPAPASPTATPGPPTRRHHRRRWCRSGTATACPRHARNRAEVLGRRPAAAGARAGSAWTSSWSTSGDDRRARPATRSCCSARRATASRPRRTGPRPAAPSPTRSSPGSAAGSRRRHVSTEGLDETHAQAPVARGRRRRGRRAAAAGDRRGVVRRAPGHRAPRRRRAGADAFGSPALRRRSPSSPTTASPCTPRSTRCAVPDEDGEPGRRRRRAPAEPPDPTVVFVHGYALNLDCWHFQRADYRGKHRAGVLRPALARPLRPLRPRATRPSTSSATTSQRCSTSVVPEGPVVLVGHSMGGMTIMALAEQHPELFGDRVVGVGADLDHRRRPRARTGSSAGCSPTPSAAQIGPAADRRRWPAAPELVDRRAPARLATSASWSTDQFAFGEDVPAAYVEFVDKMLAATPFEVVAEFFPNFDTLDKFDAARGVRAGADHDHLRHQGQAHLGRAQPQDARSGSPARRWSSARAPATW